MAYYLTVNIEAKDTPTADRGSSKEGHMWYSLEDNWGQVDNYEGNSGDSILNS